MTTATTTKLTLKDRILIPSLLPEKGSFEQLTVCEDILAKTRITQDEIVDFQISTNAESNSVTWDLKDKEDAFYYEFTALEKNEFKKALASLNEAGKLPKDYLNIYKLFVISE